MLTGLIARFAQQFSKVGYDVDRFPCIRTRERDNIRVLSFDCGDNPGQPKYVFAIDELMDDSSWRRIAVLPDEQAQLAINLLQESIDSVNRGHNRLRTISVQHKSYIIDEKLMQLRNINNPFEVISLPSDD